MSRESHATQLGTQLNSIWKVTMNNYAAVALPLNRLRPSAFFLPFKGSKKGEGKQEGNVNETGAEGRHKGGIYCEDNQNREAAWISRIRPNK